MTSITKHVKTVLSSDHTSKGNYGFPPEDNGKAATILSSSGKKVECKDMVAGETYTSNGDLLFPPDTAVVSIFSV